MILLKLLRRLRVGNFEPLVDKSLGSTRMCFHLPDDHAGHIMGLERYAHPDSPDGSHRAPQQGALSHLLPQFESEHHKHSFQGRPRNDAAYWGSLVKTILFMTGFREAVESAGHVVMHPREAAAETAGRLSSMLIRSDQPRFLTI